MEEIGYNNYYAVLNLKDFGIPHSRERVVIVSIRKDIDIGFTFPTPIPLTRKLSDYIESGTVDRDISLCITARYAGVISPSQDYMRRRYLGKSICQLVYENTSREEQLSFYKKDPYGVFECDGYMRPLTPKECFRLMGVKDEDYDKVTKNQSDSSLYHLAGDSIVVNVLMAIFKELL